MKLDELTDKAIDYIFSHIEEENMTPWENGFVISINDQWTRKRFLTDDQKLKLGEIWDQQP